MRVSASLKRESLVFMNQHLLTTRRSGVYTCTSNGALRLTKFGENYEKPVGELAAIPMRLTEWRLAQDEQTFAYAGDEVELSVWNTEEAFSKQTEKSSTGTDAQSKKRKRADQLLPGEIWRAKNVGAVK